MAAAQDEEARSLAETIADKLDRLEARSSRPPRPKHLRWLPIPLLLMALLGFAMHVGGDRNWSEYLSAASFLATAIMVPFGPLRSPTRQQPLDEREQLLRTRAMLAGTSAVSVLTLGGVTCFFWLGDRFNGWEPTTNDDWWFIFLFLCTVFGCVQTLHASWTTRPIGEEA